MTETEEGKASTAGGGGVGLMSKVKWRGSSTCGAAAGRSWLALLLWLCDPLALGAVANSNEYGSECMLRGVSSSAMGGFEGAAAAGVREAEVDVEGALEPDIAAPFFV